MPQGSNPLLVGPTEELLSYILCYDTVVKGSMQLHAASVILVGGDAMGPAIAEPSAMRSTENGWSGAGGSWRLGCISTTLERRRVKVLTGGKVFGALLVSSRECSFEVGKVLLGVG